MRLNEKLSDMEHSSLAQVMPHMSSAAEKCDSTTAGRSQSPPASNRSSTDAKDKPSPRNHTSQEHSYDSKPSYDGSSGEAASEPGNLDSQQAVSGRLPNSSIGASQTSAKESKPKSLAGLVKRFQEKAKASAKAGPLIGVTQISPEMARKFDSTDQPRLLRLLRSNTPRTRNERDEAVVCTLEMRTKPTVVFSCRTAAREQQIRKALTGSLFKRYLDQCGYEVMIKVDAGVGYRGASSGHNEPDTLNPEWTPNKEQIDVLLSSSAGTLEGSLVMIPVSKYEGTDRKTKSVYSTFGGLLSIDGDLYGLTTAHALWADGSDNPSTADERPEWRQLAENEQASAPPERYDLTTVHTIRAESPDNSVSADELPDWAQLAGAELVPASGQVEGRNQTRDTASPGRVDWLLFAVKPELMLPNLVTQTWSQEELQSRTEIINCTIYSPRGATSGSLRLATSLVCLPRMDLQAYCVDLDHTLENGESGSWVIANDKLLGLVVAGSDDPPRAYAQAAYDVFDDISEQYSSRVALPAPAERDLLRLKSVKHQQDSILVNEIPVDHLTDAIPLLILSKTNLTIDDGRKHLVLLDKLFEEPAMPLFPPYKFWSTSLHSLSAANTYSGILWLASLCPVADAVFTSCQLILADRTDLPNEISNSHAGDNLMFLLHAFRALVHLQELPNFLSTLLRESEVPPELIPSARKIAELALEMDDILMESGWNDSKEQLEIVRHTFATKEEIHAFASLLSGLNYATYIDSERDNVLLCFGPLGDWISLYCSEYLRLSYWRWKDENELQSVVKDWLSQDVVRPWPRVWIVDTPGRIYTCRGYNTDLSKTYKSLISQLDGGAEITLEPNLRNNLAAKSAEIFERNLRDRIADADLDAQTREKDKSHGQRRRARRAAKRNEEQNTDEARGPHTTALQAAAAHGHRDVVQTLLAQGADVNAPGRTWGTALQAAARHGDEKLVRILLEKGANVKAGEDSSDTALQTATRSGHKEVVRLLLRYGADPRDVGDGYETPLESASRFGHVEIVEMLLASGADPNQRGNSYDTALEAAASRGYNTIVEMLLKRGANPNT